MIVMVCSRRLIADGDRFNYESCFLPTRCFARFTYISQKKNTYPVGTLGCRVRLGVMLPPVPILALEIDSFSKILVKIALCWLP
jgi:hypothetical protein